MSLINMRMRMEEGRMRPLISCAKRRKEIVPSGVVQSIYGVIMHDRITEPGRNRCLGAGIRQHAAILGVAQISEFDDDSRLIDVLQQVIRLPMLGSVRVEKSGFNESWRREASKRLRPSF